MPKTYTLNWEGFSHGEDSATAAVDLLSVPNGYAAKMQNIEPRTGRLKPRYGCPYIPETGTMKSVTWMGEYQEASRGYALWVDSGDLYACAYGGSKYLVKAGWLNGSPKVSSVRCGKYLVLNADQEGSCLVIEENLGILSVFNATIQNTDSPFASVYSSPRIDGKNMLTPLDLTASYGDSPDAVNFTGDFNVCKPRYISHTWVKLPSGFTKSVFDAMPSAKVESWEDVTLRKLCEASKIFTKTATRSSDPTAKAEYFYRYDGMGDVKASIKPGFVAPDGATHLRVYMTLPAPVTNDDLASSNAIAAGLALRWLCDISINDLLASSEFTFPNGDGFLQGSVNLAWSTGRDDIPPGGFMKFSSGRLFIGGGEAQTALGSMKDNPGRVYYSAIMDGATDQLSRLLSFSYMTDYVDTSTDESEPCVGAGISQGNLILFNPASVWSLRDGDPDYAPQQISNLGAIGGITEINQRIHYLSQEGPAVVSGSVVEILKPFKHEAATPGINLFSQFFQRGGKRINGIWHNDSWILSDGEVNAALLMRGNDIGTWTIVTAVKSSMLYHCFPKKGICWIGGYDKPFLSLMQQDAVFDGGFPFLAKLYTNGTEAPAGIETGEAYALTTGTRWADTSQLKIAVISDGGRVSDIYGFEESHETGAASLPAPMERGPVVQGVMAGAVGHWFMCGLEKYIWDRNVLFGPIHLDLLARNYHAESISVSDAGRPEPILDAGYFTKDTAEEITEI